MLVSSQLAFMMKNLGHLILLAFWLFAIVAPSVVSLMDADNPIVITNLNEEEQQESGKKSQAEEKIINRNTINFALIAQSKKSITGDYYMISHIDHPSEILLPPPEQIL